MKEKQIGYYDYTVILTYCGMLLSFYGILRVLEEDFSAATICMMLAGVCDMFDGTIANTKKRSTDEKRFGIQIDSLSDLIAFGVFPALFIYVFTEKHLLAGFVSALYVLAALIRLALFNVSEEKRQSSCTGGRDGYLGLPVTTIAVTLPVAYLLYDISVFRSYVFPVSVLLFSAAGFLAPFEIKKPKIIGKICLLCIGFIEAFIVAMFMGWGAL